jgi:hypothetical protein
MQSAMKSSPAVLAQYPPSVSKVPYHSPAKSSNNNNNPLAFTPTPLIPTHGQAASTFPTGSKKAASLIFFSASSAIAYRSFNSTAALYLLAALALLILWLLRDGKKKRLSFLSHLSLLIAAELFAASLSVSEAGAGVADTSVPLPSPAASASVASSISSRARFIHNPFLDTTPLTAYEVLKVRPQ